MTIKAFVFIAIIYFLIACAAQNSTLKKMDTDQQASVITQADVLLKQGKYVKARQILNVFMEKYPASPYADDAAYRLAYMKTIADSANPFFDYAEAGKDFRIFCKQFPQSAYLSACNNWQKILNLYFESNKQIKRFKTQLERQKKTIDRLTAENDELRRTLTDLEKALER